jgi:hypothetical protein
MIDGLSGSQKEFLEEKLKGDALLIAHIQSSGNWFAVTASELVYSIESHVQHIRLSDINGIAKRMTVEDKRSGGTLELGLRDGAVLPLRLESGRLFVAMLNVFMYVVKMNRPPRVRGLS